MPAGWSLGGICAVLALNGFGVGTMYPFTTVTIQNAVLPHQFGIATGTVNFFRQLGGAIIVAVFAAIVLGGGEAGEGARADAFRWVFVAAALFLAAAMLAVMLAEERPLRGPATRVKQATPPPAA
jgi:hypothetical protein